MPRDAGLSTTEKGRSPMDEVGVEISGGDGVEEESMIDMFKSFTYVNRDGGSSKRRLLLVEASSDASDKGKKRRGGRVVGTEAVLRW